jgi:hypothetical protein
MWQMKKFIILALCLGLCLAICKTDSWGQCGGMTMVQGNKNSWTHIGAVKKGFVMKMHADGVVDFGCAFGRCKDSAEAGVEGKSLVFVKVFDTLKQQIDAAKTLNPVEATKKNINSLKSIFGSTHQANFDQGGVWIKVVKKNGTPYIGTQLYYFWAHGDGINKHGLPIDEDVDVYAKAHDGGKSPDSTKSYGDNHGAYRVWIECAILPSAASGSAPPVAHYAQPVAPPPVSYPTGTGTRINVKSCTNCAGECTAGHTCIYVNGACFVSCQ